MRLPGLEADACNGHSGRFRHLQRHFAAVAGDDVAIRVQAFEFHLKSLNRRIDKAHGAADGALFAHHMPRLQRLV